jgi:hypothetical protein
MSKMGDDIIRGEEEGWLENTGEPNVYQVVKRPLHKPRRKLGKLPFAEMEVGDVFVVPSEQELQEQMTDEDQKGWASALRNRIQAHHKANPDTQFSARMIPEGVECQRVR